MLGHWTAVLGELVGDEDSHARMLRVNFTVSALVAAVGCASWGIYEWLTADPAVTVDYLRLPWIFAALCIGVAIAITGVAVLRNKLFNADN